MGNLFFGFYSIVAALRGDFLWAGWFVVIAATLDVLDGRVARFTRTGSDFGAELDSLTDAISFGVAPAVIVVQLYFSVEADWSWVLGFVYVAAVVVRLARFNVEQGGEARRHFHGLPAPTAGVVLATHYPFSQTGFYQQYLVDLPWPNIMVITIVLTSVLMLSHVPYAMIPTLDMRTRGGITLAVVMAAGATLAILFPSYLFFPVFVLYTLWGLLRSAFFGLMERLPDRDPLLDTPSSAGGAREARELNYTDLTQPSTESKE